MRTRLRMSGDGMTGRATTLYLDHMACTPLDPRVLAAMRPWLEPGAAGNAASAHRAGWRARDAVEAARGAVATLIGAARGEIVFTSGATEANNLALLGAARPGMTVLVSAIEHPSVLACLPVLEKRGCRTLAIPVGGDGRLRLDALVAALADVRRGGALLSIQAANNEVGTIQPLTEVVALAKEAGVLVHSDAVQILSTGTLDVRSLPLDLVSLSGHKIYGPQGIGALWVRDGVTLEPVLMGGGQERGLRPGTLPVAGCVGLGAACRLVMAEREADAARLRRLRDRFWQSIREVRSDAVRNGAPDGLPQCLNVTLPGVDAEDLLLDVPELCASTGSACSTGQTGPSPVLLAMGRSAQQAHASLRFGLGRFTGEDEVDHAAAMLASALAPPDSAPA